MTGRGPTQALKQPQQTWLTGMCAYVCMSMDERAARIILQNLLVLTANHVITQPVKTRSKVDSTGNF